MFKSTCNIESLSPSVDKEIVERVKGAKVIIVIDGEGNLTPISVDSNGGSKTQIIDRKTAEDKIFSKESVYTSLPKTITISTGTGSRWVLVDAGGGDLIWVYE